MSRPGRHELEQEGAFLRGVAAVAREYYAALVAEGVPDPLASLLVREWHALFLTAHEQPDRTSSGEPS